MFCHTLPVLEEMLSQPAKLYFYEAEPSLVCLYIYIYICAELNFLGSTLIT